MDQLTAEKIIRTYGDVIAAATEQKYPGLAYPQSLLANSKDDIKSAILCVATYTKDENTLKQLGIGFHMLELFIDDDEAERQNNQMKSMREEIKMKMDSVD